jgi:hypothetical protein
MELFSEVVTAVFYFNIIRWFTKFGSKDIKSYVLLFCFHLHAFVFFFSYRAFDPEKSRAQWPWNINIRRSIFTPARHRKVRNITNTIKLYKNKIKQNNYDSFSEPRSLNKNVFNLTFLCLAGVKILLLMLIFQGHCALLFSGSNAL